MNPKAERLFSSRFDYVSFLNEVERKKPKHFELTFRYRDVTQKERGFYFAGVIELVHYLGIYGDLKNNVLSDIVHVGGGIEMSVKDAYHERLKRDFNGVEYINAFGNKETIGTSINKQGETVFWNFIARLDAYVTENHNVRVPTPDEYNLWLDNAPDFNENFLIDCFIPSIREFEFPIERG